MHLLTNRFREMNTKGQIVGVFHGDAAYMMVNDEAYIAYRKVITKNPYKGLLAELLKQGVQIEECVVSMKNHAWGTEDLLPGVKVNAGAVGCLIQLTQERNVQIQPYTWRVQRRSKGEKQCKTIWAALGLDAMTALWELAYGPETFKQRSAQLNDPMPAINVYDQTTQERLFPPYRMKEIDGLRISLVGRRLKYCGRPCHLLSAQGSTSPWFEKKSLPSSMFRPPRRR